MAFIANLKLFRYKSGNFPMGPVFKALVQGCKHVFLLLAPVALFRRPEPMALPSVMFPRLLMLLLFLLFNNSFVLFTTRGSAKASPFKIIITIHRAKHGFFYSGNSNIELLSFLCSVSPVSNFLYKKLAEERPFMRR
jgi:hypothetical protein